MIRTIYTDAAGRQRVQYGTDPVTLAIQPRRRPRRKPLAPIPPLADDPRLRQSPVEPSAAPEAPAPAPAPVRALAAPLRSLAALFTGLLTATALDWET